MTRNAARIAILAVAATLYAAAMLAALVGPVAVAAGWWTP